MFLLELVSCILPLFSAKFLEVCFMFTSSTIVLSLTTGYLSSVPFYCNFVLSGHSVKWTFTWCFISTSFRLSFNFNVVYYFLTKVCILGYYTQQSGGDITIICQVSQTKHHFPTNSDFGDKTLFQFNS